MTKKDFSDLTLADLLKWQATALREQPDTPSQKDCKAAPSVSSYTTIVRGVHTLVVAKLDNGQTLSWNMNHFITRNLALNLLAIGQQMQWLDKNNELSLTKPKE